MYNLRNAIIVALALKAGPHLVDAIERWLNNRDPRLN